MTANLSLYPKRVLGCVFAALIVAAFSGRGATVSWTNTSGGVWSSPANWSPNIVPGFLDNAQITAAGTYTVTIDTNVSVASLTLGGSSGAQTLTNYIQSVAITNSCLVGAKGILSLGGGTLSGGPITLQG